MAERVYKLRSTPEVPSSISSVDVTGGASRTSIPTVTLQEGGAGGQRVYRKRDDSAPAPQAIGRTYTIRPEDRKSVV